MTGRDAYTASTPSSRSGTISSGVTKATNSTAIDVVNTAYDWCPKKSRAPWSIWDEKKKANPTKKAAGRTMSVASDQGRILYLNLRRIPKPRRTPSLTIAQKTARLP
ncbi:MAG: hypothetical protein KJP12_01455 [Acidimicrobiia bacterium]|nr:hypothetical protein [Acidimicrobiia bacterium]